MYYRKTVNPLMGTGNYSATPNNLKLVWPVLAVPNVTAHPSMASVPITVLLYNGPLLYDFNVLIKGLTCPWNFDNWRAVSVSYSTCSGARREVWYVWLYLQKADMAASPILITDARRQVVDFSTPFMTTQATLLLRRPPPGAELSVKDLADHPSWRSRTWQTSCRSRRSSTALYARASFLVISARPTTRCWQSSGEICAGRLP